MRAPTARVVFLVLGSGFCALVYQVTWLRLFRLVFGASTAASAAVLAIFMAGLGAGSILLGRRADGWRRPLAAYGRLEAGIALAAAASPFLLVLVQRVYVGLGGTAELGHGAGTVVRLLLSALVLAAPTFLMGGTLPAVARAVERAADAGRRDLAALYGANTLGAVLGALATTFVTLELLGVRRTLWAACAVNLVLALLALRWGDRAEAEVPPSAISPQDSEPESLSAAATPVPFVLVASGLVGFAFFLMELVWYRMLGPILGGSSYTLGLILAVALLGIGAGGLLYAAGERRRRPTLAGFAATCALEALVLLLPFAAGDRLALLALLLRPAGETGFGVLVAVWSAVAALVVLPAALVAGYQFPLLVGLLGSGERQVGRQVGQTYAANTLGAIAGSLAGGFGLLPLLSAPGAWRLAALLLAGLAAAALALARRRGSPEPDPASAAPEPPRRRGLVLPLVLLAAALPLAFATGPTAVWRHTPIGAGRADAPFASRNALRDMARGRNRAIAWQADGLESSVALRRVNEYQFMINGKSDGSARGDAPTQVMSGLVGAALHPDPRRGLVIGLGTGSTAGWLAAVPGMERVDVVEIEPAIVDIARWFTPVNHGVLAQPHTRVHLADGREFLLTARGTYDVIFSEPSNPYRAGISSLFTREFYRAVRRRLGEDGIFLQWLQGYEVDARVVHTAYATLAAVFPHVETWQVDTSDLMLVSSLRPIRHDPARVRARAAVEPWRSALAATWGTEGAEGLYAGFLAAPAFAAAFRRPDAPLSTDDQPRIEFGFARNLGRRGLFDVAELRRLAAARGQHGLPAGLDPGLAAELDSVRHAAWGTPMDPEWLSDPAARARAAARRAYARGDLPGALRHWRRQPGGPLAPYDRRLLAESLAHAGDPAALPAAAALRRTSAVEAEAVLGLLAFRQGRPEAAAAHLERAFHLCRTDPWPDLDVLHRALALAGVLGLEQRQLAARLDAALARPFAAQLQDEARLRTRIDLSLAEFPGRCAEVFAAFEPDTPWEERFLVLRQACYERTGNPRAARARAELDEYLAATPPRLDIELAAPGR